MSLFQDFQQFIAKENLFSPKDELLLAVSGGIDSVVLCELCQQAGYDFVIAHCNFQLRGAESERDEQFVRSLGEKYSKQVLVKRFETAQYAATNKVSIQVAARELRYGWFFEILSREASDVSREDSSAISRESSKDPKLGGLPAHASRLTPDDSPTHVSPLTSDDSQLTPHAWRLTFLLLTTLATTSKPC